MGAPVRLTSGEIVELAKAMMMGNVRRLRMGDVELELHDAAFVDEPELVSDSEATSEDLLFMQGRAELEMMYGASGASFSREDVEEYLAATGRDLKKQRNGENN